VPLAWQAALERSSKMSIQVFNIKLAASSPVFLHPTVKTQIPTAAGGIPILASDMILECIDI